MTILVADDNLASRELMRGEVTNGPEALDLIDRDPPDVVFLDLQMPILDGFCVVGPTAKPTVSAWPIWGTV